MSETAEVPVQEKSSVPFSEQVAQAIDEMAEGIGSRHEAFTEIVANALEQTRSGERFPNQVFFDLDGKSYGYSNAFKQSEELEPLDALGIVEGDRSLFLQVSRPIADAKDLIGEAELLLGDQPPYVGEEALIKMKEGFPEFYPAPREPVA